MVLVDLADRQAGTLCVLGAGVDLNAEVLALVVCVHSGIDHDARHWITSLSAHSAGMRSIPRAPTRRTTGETHSGPGLHPSTLAEGLAVKGVSMRRSGQTAVNREADRRRG